MRTSLTVTLRSGAGAGALGPCGRLTITLARERLGGGMDGPLLRHDHLPAPASPRAGGARERTFTQESRPAEDHFSPFIASDDHQKRVFISSLSYNPYLPELSSLRATPRDRSLVQHASLVQDTRLLNCIITIQHLPVVVQCTSHSRELGKRRSWSSELPGLPVCKCRASY